MKLRLVLAFFVLTARTAVAAPSAEVLWHEGDAPGTLLVSFKDSLGAAGQEALTRSIPGRVDLSIPLLRLQRVQISGGTEGEVNAAIRAYRASPLVLAAEPDHPFKAASITLNDPLYTGGEQWDLTATAWPQAVAAYNAGLITLSAPVTVAVLDTGVDAHVDLGTLLAGASFVSGDGTTDDLNGHGTMCSGLIAANTGNGSGMAGAFFAPSFVRLLPVKVLNSCGHGFSSEIAAGIVYAVQQGARVISFSIEGSQGSQAMEGAVAEARRNGVLIVAASGNGYGNGTGYPAVYPQVLAVGALARDGSRAVYSSYGKLDLSAPGGDFSNPGGCPPQTAPIASNSCPDEIWSMTANRTAHSCPNSLTVQAWTQNDGYEAAAGTSLAAPLVAAAAALLFSQDPSRSLEEVQRILLQTASPTALGPGYHPETGWGELNFYKALTFKGSEQSGAGSIKAYNWPNPFNPDKDAVTTLTFFLPETAATRLRLLDAGGDLVRRWDLDATKASAGMNLVAWDGYNGAGAKVANGAYTLVVESAGRRATAFVAVLR